MTWAVPRTYVAGEVTSAAHLNQDARDNFAALVPQENRVDTSQTTASTSMTDLATVGPTVTLNTLTQAHVFISAQLTNNTSNAWAIMGVAVSGATTVAADDLYALQNQAAAANNLYAGTIAIHFPSVGGTLSLPSLTAGSNTFTAKYRVTAGTGTFLYRQLIVIPAGPDQ